MVAETLCRKLARGLRLAPAMAMEQQARSRHASPRVRNARDALLDGAASALLQSVRDIICEPTRTQIVRALTPGPLSVGDLATILGRSKSATSQHLRVLRDSGIVSARRRGRAVIYSLAAGPMVEATVQVLETAATIAAA
jgi:DNA-binding transcriptional ArsR family regulator